MKAVDKLIQRQKLTKEEFIEILKQQDDPDIRELLKEEAVRLRKHYYGTKVFTRGLIEFTLLPKILKALTYFVTLLQRLFMAPRLLTV